MVGLHAKVFRIHVWLSENAVSVAPDLTEEVVALTSLFAIQQVMKHHGVVSADLVCATLAEMQNRATWFFAVRLTKSGLTYSPGRSI
ncbi:hypothetical protein [Dictyobacter aurantiacus]|uniref:Uncharacterized protein n=1 Tax=Dictyobacter aurantiacus TaxID=1936993 RepID=A0A401ZFV0_9CHLR|nr:hypothetical protein [Dictyobacter aurantiacus]GCE05764.1 hypothetical protein KDAU_30930 [Dictyobacter aurantiacus]